MLKRQKKLEKSKRMELITLLYEYLIAKFNGNITAENAKSVCRDVVKWFPSLKCAPSSMGGIVGFCSSFIIKHYRDIICNLFLYRIAIQRR